MLCTSLVVIFALAVFPYAFRPNAEAKYQKPHRLDRAISADAESGEKVSDDKAFPKDFLFGVTISAPQYEGAWNESDKGHSVWDYMTHEYPTLMRDGSNLDVANDFYHHYKEDLRRARSIGTQVFRLSLSWTRLLPNGFTNYISQDGVKFYKNLLDEILANGMIPMVIMFHWDLPYNMQKMGGLANRQFIDWFEQYARFVFATFGDKVKFWATINEPNFLCNGGYGDTFFIPSLNVSGIADYLCGHHALLAHARAYRLYDREFRASQNGMVGIVNNFGWFEPLDPSSEKDAMAVENGHHWFNWWLTDPIFSSTGDYPQLMQKRVASSSRAQGFAASRLPSFTEEEIRDVRGSADFLGMNYRIKYETLKGHDPIETEISYDNDAGLVGADEYRPTDAPWSFGKLLQLVNRHYNRPTIYITENGFHDSYDLDDKVKVSYLRGHLAEVLKAVRNGADIRGYMIWTLLDCFEWDHGYQLKYGLFQVDFSSANLTRTPRASSEFIARVYKTRSLE